MQNTSEKNSGKASSAAQRHSFSYRGCFCETRNVRRLNLREKKKDKGKTKEKGKQAVASHNRFNSIRGNSNLD